MKKRKKQYVILVVAVLFLTICSITCGCGDSTTNDSEVSNKASESNQPTDKENFEKYYREFESRIMESEYSEVEILTNLSVDSSWYDEEDEGYVTIDANLTEEEYELLNTESVSSEDMQEYEKLLMDMNKYCFDISQEYLEKDCGIVHVYFYVFPPGKGEGTPCFSYVSDEGIESDPFGFF